MIPPFLSPKPPTTATQVPCASLLKCLTPPVISAPPAGCPSVASHLSPDLQSPSTSIRQHSETSTLTHKLPHHLTPGLQTSRRLFCLVNKLTSCARHPSTSGLWIHRWSRVISHESTTALSTSIIVDHTPCPEKVLCVSPLFLPSLLGISLCQASLSAGFDLL